MRTRLSSLIAESAVADPNFIVLSGDHGYMLFDKIRQVRPQQFLNVGIAEQLMVSLAAGLGRQGFRPLIYGLAAFVPIRVLEQIKIDICFSRLPVIILGDGAGLVYSTLGASHQCGEDIACLRPIPNINIYSPCDAMELVICFQEALASVDASYIRIGKSDRPPVVEHALLNTSPHFVRKGRGNVCLATTGSMVSPSAMIAQELGLSCLSVPRLKPFEDKVGSMLKPFKTVIVVEEHSQHGGLASTLLESLASSGERRLKVHSLGLEARFTERCGSYQFALSEHGLSDTQLRKRIKGLLKS